MDQIFVKRLNDCGKNINDLIALRDEIDSDKRILQGNIAELTEQGQEVRKRIRDAQAEQKALRRTDQKNEAFIKAFMGAAELLLDEATFLEIEQRAGEILQNAN